MKQQIVYLFCSAILLMSFFPGNTIKKQNNTPATDSSYVVSLSGNSFITSPATGYREVITPNNGLANWNSPSTIISTYVKLNNSGKLQVKLRAKAIAGFSTIKVTINNSSNNIDLSQTSTDDYLAGIFDVPAGYLKIDIQGIKKTGPIFAELSAIVLSGSATNDGLVYCNEQSYYYWARRGPSCHLSYTIPTTDSISYYYSEIVVPAGEDKIGSYYMANGFGEGYFGIQVNSATERRILFSVWSPYQTDAPSSIPDDYKIALVKKGAGVKTGEFGNEGSGGQSYLIYNWKAATSYRFLLKGEPDNQGNTLYTAWFFPPEENEWKLIASFRRPHTSTYLKRFHSFLENFIPANGYMGRQATYHNQWVCTSTGKWLKISEATFTVDATYNHQQRVDATGGVNTHGFFLKNGGFFNNNVTPYTKFTFQNKEKQPSIDRNKLP